MPNSRWPWPLIFAATAQTAARADDAYPSRLVRLVVGFPAGSATDINARILADGLSRKMRQTVIVDNVPGAGGLIALNMVLRSKPDGYTVLVTPPSFAINKIVYKKRGSDPGLWVPVSLVATTPYLLDAQAVLLRLDGQGFDRAGQGPSRYDHLCFGRRRLFGAARRAADFAARRDHDGPRAVQRRGSCA